MDRSNRLAGLTLVTKHFPVANYSYPRTDSAGPHTPSAPYSATASHFRLDRSSLGSEGSAPGLIEDRTDSEVSVDDDYQYHAHGAELWDSFWQAGVMAEGRVERRQPEEKQSADKQSEDTPSGETQHPAKQYPALIPSPYRRKRQPVIGGRPRPSWPLPNSAPSSAGGRKPAATYSPFPKPQQYPPPTRAATATPSPTAPSTPRRKPRRPARPDSRLLTPCIQQPAKVPIVFAPVATIRIVSSNSRPSTPCEHRPTISIEHRPSTATDYRPKMSLDYARPKMSLDQQRACRSLDGGPSSAPMRTSNPFYSYSAASNSATNLSASEPKPKVRTPRSYKSTTHLSAAAAAAARPATPEPEPHSVFELDDSDCESDSHGLSFFRFHKRADSDNRRITKSSDQAAASSAASRRARANTAPSSPGRQSQDRQSKDETSSRKKQGGDVFGRMLGRRSR